MEGKKMGYSAANALDCKGFPADKTKTGGWLSSALILGIEFNERLSTMGIAVNLVTYFTGTMHLSSAASANIVTNFMGTSFLLSLLGGFLADSFLGRFKTTAIFAFVQTFGTALLAVSTHLPQLHPPPCQQANASQMALLYASLYLIALGTGGLKSSVSGFGSDQFDENDEKERSQLTLFFGRFFFLISIGTLIAVTFLVYIQDQVNRSLGYGICSASMLIAIVVLLAGRKRYRYKKCGGSPIVHIMQVISASIGKRRIQEPVNCVILYEDTPESERIHRTHQFRFLDKAAMVTKEDEVSNNNPWKLSSVTKVEEVKMMIKLLPIWGTTIIFWTTYAQMITFSVEQASTMQRNIGSFQIPAASLTFFFVAAILIALAVYDRFIIPFLKIFRGKPGFSSLRRIGIGLFLSALGMAAASLAEVKRLSVAKASGHVGTTTTTTTTTTTLPISVFILIPQFFLVGAGEGFIYSGQLDFFITQAPKGMKTMSTGLFLTTISLGFFFSSLLVSIVEKVTTSGGGKGWVGHSINNGRLDCFYGLLAILSFIDFGIYLLVALWYKPQECQKNLQMQSVAAANSSTEEENC